MSTLTGKVAFVTGGSRGIGAAIVKKLASEGASIAFTYISSAAKANELVTELENTGTKALAIQADSGDTKAITEAVNQAAAYFGKLDILVNNAGIIVLGSIDQADELAEQYNRQFDVNVHAVSAAIRAASKHLSNGGRIISLGSTAGTGLGMAGMTDYSASKAAVAAYTRGYAWDLGPKGITVNVVQPGPIKTDMNPEEGDLADFLKSKNALKRYGKAEEVAALISFLAGPDAGFITGATINIDGGSLA